MTDNLLPRLLKDESKTGELEVFFAEYFGGAIEEEKRKIIFGNKLEVEYRKQDRTKIKAIRTVDDLEPTVLDDLEKSMTDALYGECGNDVCTMYFFNGFPIEGTVRVADDFQIIPAPQKAKEMYPVLSEKPALIQFVIQSSSHTHVKSYRSQIRSRELLNLLTVLVRGGAFLASNAQRQKCIFEQHADIEQDELGFYVNPEWQPIPRKDHSAYYSDFGFSLGDEFHLPDTFEHGIKRYYSLAYEEKKLFQLSAHWLGTSSEVYRISQSLAFCSLVYALEGLLLSAKEKRKCEECGKDKSISERFRDLLNEYCAGCSKDDIDQIYSLRSAIAHGGKLMPEDVIGWDTRFTADKNEKDALFMNLRNVCGIALINWLHSDNRTTMTTQIESDGEKVGAHDHA